MEVWPITVGLVLVGLFPIAAAYFDWEWFMTHRKTRLFVSALGRKGARIFYALLGLAFIIAGIALLVSALVSVQ